MKSLFLAIAVGSLALGCSESTGGKPDGGAGTGGLSGEGTPVHVPLVATGRTFVDLAKPAPLDLAGDGMSSKDWDLAFEALNVLTNGGVSGPGDGSAFGPNAPETFLDDFAPTVPFLSQDETGGAFIDWWIYDPENHVIFSRYHVFGVKNDADGHLYKVQVLGFYGDVMGAPVTAIYSLRWADVSSGTPGPTQELTDLDGTAGGKDPPPDAPSECIDLGTGARTKLTPVAALTDKTWDLCFRRETISLNGGVGGPRGDLAVDLDIAKTDGETLAVLKEKTADSELPAFEAVGEAELTKPGLDYEGDKIFSAFTEHWLEPGAKPPKPADYAWLVVGADGATKFTLVFDPFDYDKEDPNTPTFANLRVKTVE